MVAVAMKLKDACSWKKSCDQSRQHIKKQRYYLSTNVCLVKAMAFLVNMYGCEHWTIKKVEHWRIDAFELWCWRRPFRVLWTAKRSNQSILKVISPEYSLEGLMLKLKLQYFGTWCEKLTHWKDPDARKDGRQEEKGKAEDEMVGWHHQLPELAQIRFHWVDDAIQPSHLLSSLSHPAFNISQH